jgi:hypothetical protein
LPLSVSDSQPGKELVAVIAAAGVPNVVIAKDPGFPATNVVLLALVNDGASCTVSVNVCVAAGATALSAFKAMVYVPPEPAVGVPDSVAAPPLDADRCSQLGNALVAEIVASGVPVLVTLNDPADPTVKVVLLALVIVGA